MKYINSNTGTDASTIAHRHISHSLICWAMPTLGSAYLIFILHLLKDLTAIKNCQVFSI